MTLTSSSDAPRPRRWLRKAQVSARYGGISARAVERHVVAKRLPPPEYPLGNRVPMWDADKLDENDRRAAVERRVPVAGGRPYRKNSAVIEENERASA
jgi:hypothetical protein